MSQYFADKGIELIQRGEYVEALPILLKAIESNPSNYGGWYMAGQCLRFTNRFPEAIEYLTRASLLAPEEKSVFLALGIALQLDDKLSEAIEALKRALEIDANYDLAHNSLALTHMKQGDFDLALHNYDGALKAMTRSIVISLENSPKRGIVKHHDSECTLWAEYAMYGALFIASSDNTIESLQWPSGDFAISEERTEIHDGLFWKDVTDIDGRKARLFLPNYFNTFRSKLRDNSYHKFIRAKGTALEELGRISEARQHYIEAAYFQP